MKTKSMKILIVVMLVAVSALVTGVTYAYWDSLQTNDTIKLSVGEGAVISINLDSNTADGKTLVPVGAFIGENDVDSVSFTYTASLSKASAQAADFSVSVVEGSLKIGGIATHADLINVSIEVPETITNDAEFTITVTMNKPGSETVRDEVVNKEVTFDIFVKAG